LSGDKRELEGDERSILRAVEGGAAMPYCPVCLTEYVEGTSKCEDCGADLLPGSLPAGSEPVELGDEKDAKLVPVRVFTGGTAEMDAEVAQSILRSRGISSVLSGGGPANMLPVLDIQVLVSEEDAEKAARVLEEYLDEDATGTVEEDDSSEAGP
jgi:hypothetical protein